LFEKKSRQSKIFKHIIVKKRAIVLQNETFRVKRIWICMESNEWFIIYARLQISLLLSKFLIKYH